MANKTWEAILIILGIAVEVVIFLHDKLKGGSKNDSRSGSSAKA